MTDCIKELSAQWQGYKDAYRQHLGHASGTQYGWSALAARLYALAESPDAQGSNRTVGHLLDMLKHPNRGLSEKRLAYAIDVFATVEADNNPLQKLGDYPGATRAEKLANLIEARLGVIEALPEIEKMPQPGQPIWGRPRKPKPQESEPKETGADLATELKKSHIDLAFRALSFDLDKQPHLAQMASGFALQTRPEQQRRNALFNTIVKPKYTLPDIPEGYTPCITNALKETQSQTQIAGGDHINSPDFPGNGLPRNAGHERSVV